MQQQATPALSCGECVCVDRRPAEASSSPYASLYQVLAKDLHNPGGPEAGAHLSGLAEGPHQLPPIISCRGRLSQLSS